MTGNGRISNGGSGVTADIAEHDPWPARAIYLLALGGLLGIVGYVVAIYLLGVWAITRAGALEPDTFPEYALAALIGALIAGLLTLIPFLGWLVLLALSFTGVGAIAVATMRPR